MSDQKVTIDPEFRPDRRWRGDEARTSKAPAIVAAVVVVVALGWLLRSPESATSDRSAAIVEEVTTNTPVSPPAAAALGRTSPAVSSGVPLGVAVPGFLDTITAVTWRNQGANVLRWLASESAPATMLTVHDRDGGWNRSVDASGRWFIEMQGSFSLAVYAVNDGNPRSAEPRRVSGAVGNAAASSAAWHDTRPGRLAWLECSVGATGSSTEMYMADLGDTRSEPAAEALPLPDFPCEERAVWLSQWGDWGALLHVTDRSGVSQVLLNAEGEQVAEVLLGPESRWFVGVGPAGTTVWTEGLGNREASSFLLAQNGDERLPVPGLGGDERLETALVSPDGSLLALIPDVVAGAGSVVRIVEVDSGVVVAELAEHTAWVNSLVWSTDGRFLVYERWPDVESNWAGLPRYAELVFYDLEAGTSVALPLPGYALVLRTAR